MEHVFTPDFICQRCQHTPDSSHLSKRRTFFTFLIGPAAPGYLIIQLHCKTTLALPTCIWVRNNLYFWTRGPYWIITSVKINPPKLDLSLTLLRYQERYVPVNCLTCVPVECPSPEVCYRAQCKTHGNQWTSDTWQVSCWNHKFLRPVPNAAPLMCRTKLNTVWLWSDFGVTADSEGVLASDLIREGHSKHFLMRKMCILNSLTLSK